MTEKQYGAFPEVCSRGRLSQTTTCTTRLCSKGEGVRFHGKEGASGARPKETGLGEASIPLQESSIVQQGSGSTSGGGVIETQPSSDRGDADIWSWRIFSRLEHVRVWLSGCLVSGGGGGREGKAGRGEREEKKGRKGKKKRKIDKGAGDGTACKKFRVKEKDICF